MLDLRPATVKTRLHRARLLLRDDLERQVGPMLTDVFPFAGERCQRMADAVIARLRTLVGMNPGNLCAAAASNGGARTGHCRCLAVTGRFIMVFVRFAGAFAALLLASGIAAAQGAKPTDPQIAHIAYTAGQLDIEAASRRCKRARTRTWSPSPTTWCATTRR